MILLFQIALSYEQSSGDEILHEKDLCAGARTYKFMVNQMMMSERWLLAGYFLVSEIDVPRVYRSFMQLSRDLCIVDVQCTPPIMFGE